MVIDQGWRLVKRGVPSKMAENAGTPQSRAGGYRQNRAKMMGRMPEKGMALAKDKETSPKSHNAQTNDGTQWRKLGTEPENAGMQGRKLGIEPENDGMQGRKLGMESENDGGTRIAVDRPLAPGT